MTNPIDTSDDQAKQRIGSFTLSLILLAIKLGMSYKEGLAAFTAAAAVMEAIDRDSNTPDSVLDVLSEKIIDDILTGKYGQSSKPSA